MEEIPLVGGNLSDAVRVGDTVRRRAGPHTATVHALLRHLERAGFPAPRPLGIDDRGREILGYVQGETESGWPHPLPDWVFSIECVRTAARMLRTFHDVSTTFTPPADARWRIVAPVAHEVICHNDWSPANTVFRGRLPAVMLDWDITGPGSRAWDIGRAAYSWVPLYPNDTRFVLAERSARLAEICGAYGNEISPAEALDTLIGALPFYARHIEQETAAGDPGFAKLAGWNVPDRLRQEAQLLASQRGVLTGSRA